MDGHPAGHPLQQLPVAWAATLISATFLGKANTSVLSCTGVRKKSPPLFSFSDLITLKPTVFVLILELCSLETLKLVFFLKHS